MPAISIIIPVYNVEKYLRRCLDSVQNQTFQDWEAICVNDGSPDNSAAILSEYAARDGRFKIVTKENGGLSDARNAGMRHAQGEFIMYLDSDDFIHPQTMEIAHFLAVRDGSDIVSFTYDRIYRPQLMVRHILKMDTDGVVPGRMHKKYNPASVKTLVTDDVYAYATERAHNMFNPRRRWLIKHCQVWKNMYRRSLIADTPFIKGILFEDFPWWSAIMLRRPRTVITKLPLYFYMPNASSVLNSSKALRMIESIVVGLKYTFDLYSKNATGSEFAHFQREFLWPFIIISMRKVRELDNEKDLITAARDINKLYLHGVMDNPPTRRAHRYHRRIQEFLVKYGK